jgi:hypothetical protein
MSDITLNDFVVTTFKYLNNYPEKNAEEIKKLLKSDGYTEELF